MSDTTKSTSPAPMASPGEFSPDLKSLMCLCLVEGVGPRIQQTLIERFGSAAEVLTASRAELRAMPGVGAKLAERLAQANATDVEQELDLCRRHEVRILARDSQDYPRLLKEAPDPPALLYVRGEMVPADGLALAVVGSRRATHYGKRQAERLAGALARAGLTVVSGLARGIDAAAHRAALDAGGRTLAVLACGLAQVYPPEHEPLAEEVTAHGAVISEMPMLCEPRGGFFPQRNRIISGLSLDDPTVLYKTRSALLRAGNFGHVCSYDPVQTAA